MNWKKTTAGIVALGSLATGGAVAVDEQIDPYEESLNAYEIKAESVLEDAGEIKVTLHKDNPAVTFAKWNGDAGVTVKYEKVKGNGKRKFLTDKIEWKGNKEEVHAYPLEPNDQMEDGGFEIEVVLSEQPNSNVFDFEIEGAEELDFWYQSAEDCAEEGACAENVIGSYAVYHKNLKNHVQGETNYATGKAFHIFRPKAIDAEGNEVWAELQYANGKLSVVVPEEFLETAVYPVRVDPTFGYTSVGAIASSVTCSTTSSGTSIMNGMEAVLATAATLDSMSASLTTAAGSETADEFFALYTKDGSGVGSHPRVASVEALEATINTTADFDTINAAGESLSAGTYVLGVLCNGSDIVTNSVVIRRDTAASQNLYAENTTGASGYATRKAENPWTETAGASTNVFSIYATYTEVASPFTTNTAEMNGGTVLMDGGTVLFP